MAVPNIHAPIPKTIPDIEVTLTPWTGSITLREKGDVRSIDQLAEEVNEIARHTFTQILGNNDIFALDNPTETRAYCRAVNIVVWKIENQRATLGIIGKIIMLVRHILFGDEIVPMNKALENLNALFYTNTLKGTVDGVVQALEKTDVAKSSAYRVNYSTLERVEYDAGVPDTSRMQRALVMTALRHTFPGSDYFKPSFQ